MSEHRKPAEEYVVIRHRPGYRLRRSLILLTFSILAAVLGYVTGMAQGGFRFSTAEESRALLEELRHCTDGPTDTHEQALFDTLRKVVWRLAETPSPAQRPAGRSDLVRRALDRTEAKLDSQPSFAALAEDLAVTQRTLARHILAETGMTWRANLRRMRVIRAIECLADPDRSITDIALGTGYASLSAFNAAFREITGQTPSDYRDSFRS